MVTTYYLKFVNLTNDWWHFGAYQTFPDAPGLESVIWKEYGLPTNGQVQIHWNMEYGVAITNIDGRNVSALQIVSAQLGEMYQVITRDGITGIDSNPIFTGGRSDIVSLRNNTSPAKDIDMGFALDGSIIAAQKDVGGQQQANYQVHPKYYVALFRNVQVGDLVTSDITVAPIAVEYTQGNTHATVTAYINAGNTETKVEYTPWIELELKIS